jgi:hypothetical protein
MARPSEPEKRRIEERRQRNRRLREERTVEDARERRMQERVQALIDTALARPRPQQFDLDQALAELDEARDLAMATKNPYAAAQCTALKAKLCGLMIERSATALAVGRPEEFGRFHGSNDEIRQRFLEDLRERIGSARAERFLTFAKSEGLLIEGEIDDAGRHMNGDSDGA